MLRSLVTVPRCQPSLLLLLGALALLPGCQSPQGAAEARKRLEANQLAEAGFQKWRGNYRRSAERHASPPPVAPKPDSQIARAKDTYSRMQVSAKVLAMTFDDGPHPTNTPRLLDMLKQRNLKATFFVVGQNVKAHPAILRRMVAEGHEIANHTWTHPDLTKLSLAAVRKEFTDTRQAILDATGVDPKVSRPPYGAINSAVKSLLMNEFGYPTILWSVDPMDWKRPGVSVVANRLVEGSHPGAVLLAHDIHAPTIDAMPSTFDRLVAQGYKFVTVSQLIALERGALSALEDADSPELPAPTLLATSPSGS